MEALRTSNRKSIVYAYLAWAAVAFFYYYQYILRVSPGVMVTDLRQEFQMTAEQFSSLGALYLYAYSFLQIPLGILVDRVGVRRILIISILCCMGGSLLLASSQGLLSVQFSRILIGAGSACAFMSAVKVAADLFPSGKRGFLMGATLALGTIGALTAGKPLVWLVEDYGWRQTVLLTIALGALALLFVILLVRSPKPAAQPQREIAPDLLDTLGKILSNRRVMTYAILAIGLYTPLSVLADLWGTAFLMQKFSLSRADAAQIGMMMYLGLAIGSLILPWVCEKWDILDQAIKFCGVGIFITFCCILFGPHVSVLTLSAMLVILGIFCGAEMMCFTGAVRYTTKENSGITVGVVNTLNMLGGALLQQLIGFTLDALWKGDVDTYGVRIYQTGEFATALSLLLVVIAACCLISLRLTKAHPAE